MALQGIFAKDFKKSRGFFERKRSAIGASKKAVEAVGRLVSVAFSSRR